MLPAFGVFAVIAILIYIGIWAARDRKLDDANEAYQSAVDRANNAIDKANEMLRVLRLKAFDEEWARKHADQLSVDLEKYRQQYKTAVRQKEEANAAGNDAYDAYVHGVNAQNFFLGGASDFFSSLSLQEHYDQYRATGKYHKLEDPTEVIIRVSEINIMLQVHKHVIGAKADHQSKLALTVGEEKGATATGQKEIQNDSDGSETKPIAQDTHLEELTAISVSNENQADVKTNKGRNSNSRSNEQNIGDSTPKKKHTAMKVVFGFSIVVMILFASSFFSFVTNVDGQRRYGSLSEASVSMAFDGQKVSGAQNETDRDERIVRFTIANQRVTEEKTDHLPENRESAPSQRYRVVRKDGLSLRSETALNAELVKRLQSGEIVIALDGETVRRGNNEWIRVKTLNGKEGWTLYSFLEVVGD